MPLRPYFSCSGPHDGADLRHFAFDDASVISPFTGDIFHHRLLPAIISTRAAKWRGLFLSIMHERRRCPPCPTHEKFHAFPFHAAARCTRCAPQDCPRRRRTAATSAARRSSPSLMNTRLFITCVHSFSGARVKYLFRATGHARAAYAASDDADASLRFSAMAGARIASIRPMMGDEDERHAAPHDTGRHADDFRQLHAARRRRRPSALASRR